MQQLEKNVWGCPEDELPLENNTEKTLLPYIPGSGLAKYIYRECDKLGIALTTILIYAVEGGKGC
jgi:hypothetical protein